MRRTTSCVALLLLAIGLPAGGAPPAIPDQVPFAATLPGGGAGPVDLTLRIYDSETGGSLLYVQGFTSVPLADGAFSVALGPTGSATDTPDDPLTTSLVAALAGDLAAAPSRFIEITVEPDPPLPRTRVLAVPFALRAASAETAEIAGAVLQVGGVPPEVVGQIYANTNLDGGGPVNTDPREGTGDVDGDDIANFVDPDNDGDGYSDVTEVAQGSDINLITPTISGFSPSFLFFGTVGTVQVQGANFEPGISVVFGTQTPTPSNLTSSQFDVLVGPQTGPATVIVTRLNGESDSASFNFGEAPSTTHSTEAVAGASLDFDVFGAAQALVGRPGSYSVDTDADGAVDTTVAVSNLATAWTPAGRAAQVQGGGSLSYAADTDGDFNVTDETPALIESGINPQSVSLAFDPSGRPAVGYLRIGTGTQVMLARDLTSDGDFVDAGELVQIQTFGGQIVRRSELAIDAAGRAAYVYQIGPTNILRIAYDRSGDGDFNDTVGGTPEISTVTGGTGNTDCLGVAFTSAGRLAISNQSSTGDARLGRDANGDGDVNDVGENLVIAAGTPVCDVRRTAGGGLDFVYGGAGLTRLRDLNDDGDFADAGETLQLLLSSTPVTAVEIGNDNWLATQTNILFAP